MVNDQTNETGTCKFNARIGAEDNEMPTSGLTLLSVLINKFFAGTATAIY